MSTETTSSFRRHDALTLRVPRTLDETQDQRYTWWQRYEPANDELPFRRSGQGHRLIDFIPEGNTVTSFWMRRRHSIVSTTHWRTVRLVGLSTVLAMVIGLWWGVR